MEPLSAAVLLSAAGAEDIGRAHPLPPEERLLPQEGRGETQGRKGEWEMCCTQYGYKRQA